MPCNHQGESSRNENRTILSHEKVCPTKFLVANFLFVLDVATCSANIKQILQICKQILRLHRCSSNMMAQGLYQNLYDNIHILIVYIIIHSIGLHFNPRK